MNHPTVVPAEAGTVIPAVPVIPAKAGTVIPAVPVIPAKAGIQGFPLRPSGKRTPWIPAFAGMTTS